jgi:hypothetical protein
MVGSAHMAPASTDQVMSAPVFNRCRRGDGLDVACFSGG